MFKFFRLTLRPIERFLAQVIAVSTNPTAFVRERVRLGDTTNFLRAGGFFLSAISTAFLAEVATLYLLGIGGLTEPYYWLFILLTSIPFVLFVFFALKPIVGLPLKDVLHLSFYPIGAGVFTGAALALVASAVVVLFVALGSTPEIKFDFTQWGGDQQLTAVTKRALYDCLRGESLTYTVLSAGLQAAYNDLRTPIDALSYIRPIIVLLYLVVAARVFMAAVDRRKQSQVVGLVLLAAVASTAATIGSLKAYFDWNLANSDCREQVASGQLGLDLMAESALKRMAADLNHETKESPSWKLSFRAEGRTMFAISQAKKPISDMEFFHRWVAETEKDMLERYCHGSPFFRNTKSTQTHIFYSVAGERLTSFSIGPADCSKW